MKCNIYVMFFLGIFENNYIKNNIGLLIYLLLLKEVRISKLGVSLSQSLHGVTSQKYMTVLRVTSEYQSFHYMILRDYIHSSVSSEFFSFGAHIMKVVLVSLL